MPVGVIVPLALPSTLLPGAPGVDCVCGRRVPSAIIGMSVRRHRLDVQRDEFLRPRPCPGCCSPKLIGMRPRRSGSAKVVWPLPPYMVPSSENSAWFWLIGRNCPLHWAQPLGAKVERENLDLADKWGAHRADFSSTARREDALHGDAEIERQVGLHVVVRQAPARDADRERRKRCGRARRDWCCRCWR